MRLHKNFMTLSIFAVVAPSVFADSSAQNQQLETIQLQAHPLVQSAADFAVADHVVEHQVLTERGATMAML